MSNPEKSGSYRLFSSTVSLKTVLSILGIVVAQTLYFSDYLNHSFGAVGERIGAVGKRLTSLEARAIDEKRVRKIMASDSEWSHDQEAIRDMIERNEAALSAFSTRMRSVEILLSGRNDILERLIKVVETNAATRKDAREVARKREAP